MTADEISLVWANWPSAMPKPSSLGRPKASDKRLEVGRWPTCATLYPHVSKTVQINDSLIVQFNEIVVLGTTQRCGMVSRCTDYSIHVYCYLMLRYQHEGG